MEFKIDDKIYSNYHQHGLIIMDKIDIDHYKCVPIYLDGYIIDDCEIETYTIEYLKKNYVPVSKIRKRKLDQLDQLNKKLIKKI